jgi:hypothetical protein
MTGHPFAPPSVPTTRPIYPLVLKHPAPTAHISPLTTLPARPAMPHPPRPIRQTTASRVPGIPTRLPAPPPARCASSPPHPIPTTHCLAAAVPTLHALPAPTPHAAPVPTSQADSPRPRPSNAPDYAYHTQATCQVPPMQTNVSLTDEPDRRRTIRPDDPFLGSPLSGPARTTSHPDRTTSHTTSRPVAPTARHLSTSHPDAQLLLPVRLPETTPFSISPSPPDLSSLPRLPPDPGPTTPPMPALTDPGDATNHPPYNASPLRHATPAHIPTPTTTRHPTPYPFDMPPPVPPQHLVPLRLPSALQPVLARPHRHATPCPRHHVPLRRAIPAQDRPALSDHPCPARTYLSTRPTSPCPTHLCPPDTQPTSLPSPPLLLYRPERPPSSCHYRPRHSDCPPQHSS